MQVFYLFLAIFVFVSLATIAIGGKSFIAWLPTRKRDLARALLLADLKPGEIFYDLGCGDGRVVVYASRKYKVRAVGTEIALPLFLICKFKQLFYRNVNMEFVYGDFFNHDFSSADVVYVFGIPDKLKNKLRPKLEKELRSGARVVSYAFPVEGWQLKAVSKPHKKDLPIYLYVL